MKDAAVRTKGCAHISLKATLPVGLDHCPPNIFTSRLSHPGMSLWRPASPLLKWPSQTHASSQTSLWAPHTILLPSKGKFLLCERLLFPYSSYQFSLLSSFTGSTGLPSLQNPASLGKCVEFSLPLNYRNGQVQVIWPLLDSGFLRGSDSIAYLTKLLMRIKRLCALNPFFNV